MKEKMYVVSVHINGMEAVSKPMPWVEAIHTARGASIALALLGQKRPGGVSGIVSHLDKYWDVYENASVMVESESDS